MSAVPVQAPELTKLPRWANARQAYRLSLAGSMGALIGLYLYVELTRPYSSLRQSDGLWWARDLLAGVSLGGLIGFFLNSADAWRDGALIRLARAGTWGALAGAAGGAAGLVLGELVLGGLRGGLLGRAISWAILGLAIGASQGLAEKSRAKLRFGLIGGGLGGFLGGFLFELLRERLGNRYDLSQALGVLILGAGLGFFLAFVEQVLRRAWLVVLNGRQEGRSYVLSRGIATIGLDERATVGLFGDKNVARRHAEIEADSNGGFVLRELEGSGRTKVNGASVTKGAALNDGDRIELGRTLLIFRRR
jgi:Inner membrane component of T3SS, cytoplasmic domain